MKTVIAVFSDRAAAEEAQNAVQSSGFPCEHVKIYSRSTTRGAGTSGLTPMDRPSTLADTGAYGDDTADRDFLRTESVPDDYRTRYLRAVGRGGVLLMATVADEYADQAVNVMERFNPINLDEREGDIEGTDIVPTGRSPLRGDASVQTGRDRSAFGPKVFVW